MKGETQSAARVCSAHVYGASKFQDIFELIIVGHVAGKTRPTSSKLKLFSIDVSQVSNPKTPKDFCSLPRTESSEEHVT